MTRVEEVRGEIIAMATEPSAIVEVTCRLDSLISAVKKEERAKILAWIDEDDYEHTCMMHGIKCISYSDMTRHLKEEA